MTGNGWRLAGLSILAIAVRLLFFTGMALGDDVFYATQALAHAQGGAWPPEALHWTTRIGLTFPTTAAVWMLGTSPLVFVLWPLLASTATVVVCYGIAEELAGLEVAWLAALFQALFPLELIYSTHLFPDIAVGLF